MSHAPVCGLWEGLIILVLAGASGLPDDAVPAQGSSSPIPDDRPPSLNQAPVAEDIVDRYLLHPRGDVDGLLLRDGSQMYVTSRAADQLTTTIHPGDRVRVHGRRAPDSSLVKADVIINMTNGASFTVPYRLDLPIPPAEEQPVLNEMRAGGTIQVLLYDHLKGIVNGAVLSDGTQVRLPPDVGDRFHASLQRDMDVRVEGYGTETEYGRALEATAIGRKDGPLTYLDASIQRLR
jgi:hypothetical protein